MKKLAALAAVFVLTLLVGCGNSANNNTAGTNTPAGNGTASNATAAPDAVTSASVVDNGEDFKKAISKDGTWIAATLKDLTFTEDLVVDGQFIHKNEPARKIALYTQDADHNITNSFTLTAPKITIKSENARIQGGTFVGDVYVEAKGFNVVNATIKGNVYFSDEKYQATYSASDQGKVTGVTEVKK
ncbi:hypothetical protein A3844_19495 [Paenibacillus helianthi]|uniref:Polymer-forming cytoskeletal protein n=1 Tax=Paenibacillus helianthi TaxID=1349432 RepID=A0ABX3EJV3_9BACL|nr:MULTISPECIES: hypothetical protein [Paenibacillus]OKP75530.1 hypothetical protein A3842_19765 [Paenibacillus sp. P3E]OKP84675.1 hypothetical protein A3844_19495 [Paenibacillus helianthi]OKP90225.1 hypothetical protein A3848_12760 [Paenibacillus sp. P32E]